MEEGDPADATNLDKEFKKYLQILKPYLRHLVNKDLVKICDAWIQRLSNCNEHEKILRNKYIFLLCYQIARGVLDTPFMNNPPAQLEILSNDINSDEDSSEVEYLVINSNSNESKTKVLFDTKKMMSSETEYLSIAASKIWDVSADSEKSLEIDESEDSHKQRILCYQCPKIIRFNNQAEERVCKGYELRANNLVKKLRDIKMQNILLQKELMDLKDANKCCDNFTKNVSQVDIMTNTIVPNNDRHETLKSLKCQLQEIQNSRNVLIDKISYLQNKLVNLEEHKKNEIEDIEAKHMLSLNKVRIDTREEIKCFYEKKLEDLKQNYEYTLKNIQETAKNETKNITESMEKIISEKNITLDAKNKEIDSLKNQLEAQKINLQSVLNKLIEKSTEDTSKEGLKIQNQLLEKRLNKLEIAKIKCTKIYEIRLAQLQREKHLAECSLQLQLVRQRAQVVSELTEENQTELNNSLEILENRYKEIVANVQATAIQRRIQDQKTLESIFQAVCDIDDPNQSYTFTNPVRNHNCTCDGESVSIKYPRNNRIGNVVLDSKSIGENSTAPGFCLSGERMGELFEKVYIPHKDHSNIEIK